MSNYFIHKYISSFLFLAVLMLVSIAVQAQTSAFVYQGKLTDSNISANGTYEFQFKLYDANGNQIGNTLSNIPATVAGGIFAVELDFGANSFDGAPRQLEIGVRSSGTSQPYTILNPRQSIASTPYAVRSLNSNQANTALTANDAANLGGVPANQYVVTTDSRMNDSRDPKPGSGNYIQNTNNQQASATFNISGNGTAGGTLKGKIVEATDQFNINGNRVLHTTGTSNTFTGVDAGKVTTGGFNAFFGAEAGKSNTTGLNNSSFGASAGRDNLTGTNNSMFGAGAGISSKGSFNSFFGSNAGFSNFNGTNNSFFGSSAGFNNTSGAFNTFFGANAGEKNMNGISNVYIGASAGNLTTNGNNNVAIGRDAGKQITTGSNNVAIGYSANTQNFDNAIVIGANAVATENHSIIIGNQATVKSKIYGALSLNSAVVSGQLNTNTLFVSGNSTFNSNVVIDAALTVASAFEASLVETPDLRTDKIIMNNPQGGGGDSACLLQLVTPTLYKLQRCSSSLRYKNNVQDFKGGLDVVNRLRPVTFDWKENGKHDVGFVAEEVNAVEPLLSTYNAKGEIEGIKYAQISTALVNAVKEQQEQIKRQQEQIEALKALVCSQNPNAAICQSPTIAAKK